MDVISYSHSAKQAQRIKKFINDPDSTSGIVTVPKVIASGESVTIPAGRVAVLPNVQVDGTLNIQGDVFIPAGATFADLSTTKADLTYVNNKYVGFKNYIINGNFDIWQRGTSQSSSGYGSDDRWSNALAQATQSVSRQLSTDVERALFNASYFSRTVVTRNNSSTDIVYKNQQIEDVTRLAGKTVTLSFWAKADSNKNIAVQFVQNFGTGGSPSSIVDAGNTIIPLTTSWQKKTITVTLPSIVGKTLGADGVHTSFTRLMFWYNAGSSINSGLPTWQSGTFDIAQVQLEEGSVATPFENRPYGLELSLCQRYLPVVRGFYAGYASTSGEVSLSVANNVVPRVTPTGILSLPGGTVYYNNTSSPITNVFFFAGNTYSNTLKISPTGTPLTTGQGVMVGLPTILFTGCEL